MKLAVFVAVFASLAGSAFAQSGFLDRSVTLGGVEHRFQVYVPANYAKGPPLPVVVDLHGIGLQGSDGLLQTSIGLAAAIRHDRARFPVIAILPQDQAGKRWLDADMQALVIAELDQTVRQFKTDPRRIYLSGFSMGATGAYRLAYHWPNRFAAVAMIAGRVTTADVKTYSEADKGADRAANPFVAQADPFAALAKGLAGVPITIFHGDADRTVPVSQSRQLAAALQAAGANVRYRENPGGDHYDTAEKAYASDDFMPWLLTQRSPSPPKADKPAR
jgi:predicted peptidase